MQILSDSQFNHTSSQNQSDACIVTTHVDFIQMTFKCKTFKQRSASLSALPSGLSRQLSMRKVSGSNAAGDIWFISAPAL